MVYLALQNVPKGVPARVHLDETPLSVAWTQKMWRTALQRTQALAASGSPLLIVEAHVAVHEGALLAVVKGIQVVAGPPAAAKPAFRPGRANGPGYRPCGGPRRLPPPWAGPAPGTLSPP